MTVYWPIKVKCTDCGWVPRKHYYQMVSTSSWCWDGDETTRKEKSTPKLCRNCKSQSLEFEIISPDYGVKSNTFPEGSGTNQSIPNFLQRYDE